MVFGTSALGRWIAVVWVGAWAVACGRPLLDDEAVSLDDDQAGAADPGAASGTNGPSSPSGGGATAQVPAAGTTPGEGRIVFVTSRVFRVSDLDGTDGADRRCSDAAAGGATHVRGRRFVAWLSDEKAGAKERIGSGAGPWVRVDGVRVASDLAHLVGPEPLLAAIDVNERGDHEVGDVWTGTDASGALSAGTDSCERWSEPSGTATIGKLVATKPDWTAAEAVPCADGKVAGAALEVRFNRLYCFERRD